MAVNKVVLGNDTILDVSNDTVTPSALAEGVTAHSANGAIIVGTATPVTLEQTLGQNTQAVVSQKALTAIISRKEQLRPEFANSVEEFTDTSALYVLPDGYIYAYMYVKGTPPVITIESRTGGYYNFDATNNRYLFVAYNGSSTKLTNKIPVTPGDVLSYKGETKYSGNYSYVFFDENGVDISHNIVSALTSPIEITAPAGSVEVQFTSFSLNSTVTAILEVSWINCQAAAPTYRWANTGIPFIPADYEDRISALESAVDSLEKGSFNSLTGKKIVYDGDSIAESRISGAAANGGAYAKLIADKVGGNYANQAVGGAYLRSTTIAGKHSVVDNLANLPTDGDLYCFEGGINDYWSNATLGDYVDSDYSSSVDKTTVCGALETIFRYCLNNFVGKPVCFVIVHKIQNTAYAANTQGNTFNEYREKMIGICQKYSIPFYDAFAESGLNGWNTIQSNQYLTANVSGTGDGTHPNEAGYLRYYVPQLISLFEKIMPA